MEEKTSEQGLFEIVGLDYQKQVSELKESSLRDRLRGKPVFSILVLSLIFGGCLFANVIANHDPGYFYLDNINQAPNSEFFLVRILWDGISFL